MKKVNLVLSFLLFATILFAQNNIRFSTEDNASKIEFGTKENGDKYFAAFGETNKAELQNVSKKLAFIDYKDYVRLENGFFYFDSANKLYHFEYAADIDHNEKFYLNDVLLLDKHLLMKNHDELLDLGFMYYGKPKFEKTEIDLNSYYTISNGSLRLFLYPFGRTSFQLSKSVPYLIIEKI